MGVTERRDLKHRLRVERDAFTRIATYQGVGRLAVYLSAAELDYIVATVTSVQSMEADAALIRSDLSNVGELLLRAERMLAKMESSE